MKHVPVEPFHLQLHAFEGPLDLLLHLIEKDELDIYDIPIARVTDQYLALLHDSLASHMEVASEFIVMAATLIALKARSLLPRQEPAHTQLQCDLDADFEDAQWALSRRLLEYRTYKEVSQQLHEMEHQRSQVVGRMPLALEAYRVEPSVPEVLHAVTLDALTAAFLRALARVAPVREVSVVRDRETIPERMHAIERQLERGRLLFDALLATRSRREIVTVFLAILELIRMNKVVCYQEGLFAALWIDRR